MNEVRVSAAVLLVSLTVSSCHADDPESARAAQSQRERDSTIGASRLPGAHGVSGAIRVADSSTVRRAREDSIAQAGSP